MVIRWSRLGIPLCWFNRHSPIPRRARWDGKHFRGTCRYCGEPIRRLRRGHWLHAPAFLVPC